MIIQGNNPNHFYNTININGTLWLDENLKYGETFRSGSYMWSNDLLPILGQVPLASWILEAIDLSVPQVGLPQQNNWVASYPSSQGLFNLAALTDPRNIAPVGCRVATYEDYQKLFQFLGSDVGDKLKSNEESSLWTLENGGQAGFSDIFELGFYMTGHLHQKLGVWGYYDSKWWDEDSPKAAYIWTGTPGLYGDPSALRLLGNSTAAALVTVSETSYLPIRCVVDSSLGDPLFYGI